MRLVPISAVVLALALSTVLVGRQKARAEENFRLARDAVKRFYVRVSEEQLLALIEYVKSLTPPGAAAPRPGEAR